MLTNLTGREIKEMVENEMINIEALDVSSLEKLLDYETELLCMGDGDMTLIERCSSLLDEKYDGADVIDFEAVIARTRAEHVTIIPDKKYVPLRRFSAKRALIIAAALIVVSTLAVTVIGETSQYRSVFLSMLYDEFGTKQTLPNGDTVEKIEKSKYSTVEELEKGENIDLTGILYPMAFPEGYKQEYISYCLSFGKFDLDFVTDSPYVCVSVTFDEEFVATDYDEIYERNGVEYYIQKNNDNSETAPYCAYAFVNGDWYSVYALTRDDIIYIINNLEEKK